MKKKLLLVLVVVILSLMFGLPSLLAHKADMYMACFGRGDCPLWRVLS